MKDNSGPHAHDRDKNINQKFGKTDPLQGEGRPSVPADFGTLELSPSLQFYVLSRFWVVWPLLNRRSLLHFLPCRLYYRERGVVPCALVGND